MYLTRITTFFLILLSLNISASTPKYNDPMHIVLNHKIFKESALNRDIAQNIKEIYRMMRRGRANIKLINKTLRKVKKASAFNFAEQWLQNIKLIEKTKDVRTIVDNCLLSRSLTRKPLGKLLVRSVEKFCFYKIKNLRENISTEERLNVFLRLEPFFKKRNIFLSMLYKKTIDPRLKKIVLLLKEKRSEDYYQANLAHQMIQLQRIKINRNQFTQDDFKKFMTWYQNLPVEIIDRHNIQEKSIEMAVSLDRHEFEKASREFLNFLNKANYNEDALYAHLWSYTKNNDFKNALEKVIYPFKLNLVSKLNSTKLRFWIGNTHYHLGKYKMAQGFFENIIQTEPYSYYSVISNKLILKMSPNYEDFLKKQISFNQEHIKIDPKELPEEIKNSFVRLKTWSVLKDHLFLNEELSFLKKYKTDQDLKEKVNVIAATVLKKDSNYLNSFQILYNHLTNKSDKPNIQEYNILFPKPYFRKVASLSKNKVDSTVILSLIRQESGFNPSARSRVGARGLMQLMPRTARQMRRGIASKHLYKPQTNLKLGIKYFNYLLKKHEGNIVYALASYNAGSHRVDRWKKTYFKNSKSILHTIESIPFEETRNYVKLIYRNIFYYKLLNDPYKVTTTQDLNRISDVKLGWTN